MGRSQRADAGGYVYHVLNRANARMTLFDKAADYAAFERVLTKGQERYGTRILAYCVMPNHWHLVLWPKHDGELSRFRQEFTLPSTGVKGVRNLIPPLGLCDENKVPDTFVCPTTPAARCSRVRTPWAKSRRTPGRAA